MARENTKKTLVAPRKFFKIVEESKKKKEDNGSTLEWSKIEDYRNGSRLDLKQDNDRHNFKKSIDSNNMEIAREN